MNAAIEGALLGGAPPEPTIAALREAQEAYGDSNLEPSLFEAAMLARAGRAAEADALVARIAAGHPGWAVLYERLRAAGHVPAPEVS